MIVYPWDTSKFEGTPTELEWVHGNLRRLKFPLKRLEKYPGEKVEAVLKVIMKDILNGEWVLVASNSQVLLQSISRLVPVTFSLTTRESCIFVTTERLITRMRDDSDVRSEDDVVFQARAAGVLSWLNIDAVPESGPKYHSKLSEILLKRYELGRSSVFFTESTLTKVESLDVLLGKMTKAIGASGASLIEEVSKIKSIKVKSTLGEIGEMEV